ncbi:hypothetical protein BE08_35810 [Sorangium cellulosum]|uniref:Uncharacterized protein n=1 Tax=Sorangium cellulosum TaxID=56 RepID=A0A150PQ53_SORCE|nr:hypothetical protein BE08_35810 [Sorangium cellulosum]
MVEHVGRHGGVSVDKQEAMPLGQGDALTSRWMICSRDVADGLVRDQLDHAKPIGYREGADGGDDLLDGHARQDAIPAARKEVEDRLQMV